MSDQGRQNFAAKKSDQQIARRPSFIATEGAEGWAAELLTRWGKIQRDDYDFRCWMEGASEDLLNAGCLYEFSRESYEFRCLLALDRRKRGQFSGILIKFERSTKGHVYLSRSGWETWLHDFADELVANKSFAEVFRTRRSKVEEKLDQLASYNLYPKAVESPGRYINVPGMEEIVIDWRHYTNKEIAAEIACKRPENEPEPNRRGRQPESKPRLKQLSVMRIWKLYERKPWKRLELVANVCRYKGCVNEWAAYKERCRQGCGDERMRKTALVEMSKERREALNLFRLWFPWGEPSNY